MTPEEEAKIETLLASLWERSLPILHQRLDILDRAASESVPGKLSEASRAEALEIAHKLSGSLGMFGYQHGTEIAREIEQILNAPTLADSSRLASLAKDLRQTLFGE